IMIAMALANEPDLLIADEPTIAAMTAALPSPYTLEHAQVFIAQTHDQYAAG
ncbi:GCN5-related N-acetyltransferase, partial [Pseudomonas syringae pv. pisi str. 1704B]